MKHFLEKNKLTIKGAGGGAPSPPGPVAVQMYPAVLAPPLMGDTSYISSFSYAEIVDLISDGPIEGLVNKDNKKVYGGNVFEGIYLNGVPIKETSRLSSEDLDINFLKNILKNFWGINENQTSQALTPLSPLQSIILNTDRSISNNPFFYGPIDIKAYHPDDSLLALASSLNLNFDSVILAQRAFNTVSVEDELPFLTIVNIPDLIFPIFSNNFVSEDFDDSTYGLKLDITNLANHIYFNVDNQNLNLNQYIEIPRTFITATKQANPTNLKNNVVPLAGYTPVRFTDIKIYIWSIYNKNSGIKDISKAFNRYFNSIFITQSNRTLYNYNLVKTEFKNGSEIQYPLQNFKNVEIDIEFNKELVGPFKLLNNQTVLTAKTSNQGGVSRLSDLCCVATNFPVVGDLTRESSDDVRFVCSWPVEYDGLGKPLIISGINFNYSIFDKTSRDRSAQDAVPVTHYVENNNVEEVYVTLNLNTLNDTNHIDLVSAGYGNKPTFTEEPYDGTPTYAELVDQAKLSSTATIPVLTRYIIGVDISKFIDWKKIFPLITNYYSFIYPAAFPNLFNTNLDSIKYPYVAKFASEYAQHKISRNIIFKVGTHPVELIGINLDYLITESKIVSNYIPLDILNYLLDKYYKYQSTTFESFLSTFENGKLIGYSTLKGDPVKQDSTSLSDPKYSYDPSSTYNIFDATRTNYLNGVYISQQGYTSVSSDDFIYVYELISKEINSIFTALPSRTKSDLTVKNLNRKQQLTAGTKLPAVVSFKVETGYESNENNNYSSNSEYYSYRFDIYGLAQEPAYVDVGRRCYEFLRGKRIASNPSSLVYNVTNICSEINFYIIKISYNGVDDYRITNTRDFSYSEVQNLLTEQPEDYVYNELCFSTLNQSDLNFELNENGMFGLQMNSPSTLTSSSFINAFQDALYPISNELLNSIYDEDKLNVSCAFPELKTINFLNFSNTFSPADFILCSASINCLTNQCYGIDTYKFNNPDNIDLCVQFYSFKMPMFDVFNASSSVPTPVAKYKFFTIAIAGDTSRIIQALNLSGYKYYISKKLIQWKEQNSTFIVVNLPISTTSISTFLNNIKIKTTGEVAKSYSGELYVQNAYWKVSNRGGTTIGYNTTANIYTLTEKATNPLYYDVTDYSRTYSYLPDFSDSELKSFLSSLSVDQNVADIYALASVIKQINIEYQSNLYNKNTRTLVHEAKIGAIFEIASSAREVLASPNTDPISVIAKFWTLYNESTGMVHVVFSEPTKANKWAELEDNLAICRLPLTSLMCCFNTQFISYNLASATFVGNFQTPVAATVNSLYLQANSAFYGNCELKFTINNYGSITYSYASYWCYNKTEEGLLHKYTTNSTLAGQTYKGCLYHDYNFKTNSTVASIDVPGKNLRILGKLKSKDETILQTVSSLLKCSQLGENAIPSDSYFNNINASPKLSKTWNNTNTFQCFKYESTYYGNQPPTYRLLSSSYLNGDGSKAAAPRNQKLIVSYYETPLSNYELLPQNNNAFDSSERILLPPPRNDFSGSPIRRYVKVTKLSYETLSPLINKKISLSKVTEIIPQTFSYPFSSIVGMKIDSRSFSQMPTRSFHCKLKKVLVPSNYFPINPKDETDIRYDLTEIGKHKIYDGDWDGTFKLMWTDNPAWILMDMLVNRRYGLGNHISSEQIDIWELYKIARWCDGVNDEGYYYGVPDGYGGVEPRHTFNALIGDKFNVFDMINQIASVFRGHVYYMNSLVTFDDDRPKPPIGEFSNSDVKDGIFNYTNLKKDDEFTAVEIAFIDAKNDYKSTIEYVEDSEGIRKRGILKKQINAFGITSRGQARRFGKHFLHQTSKENLNATFITDIKALLYKPGDLITINDELLNLNRNFGSVKAIEEVPNSGDLFKVVIDKILDSGIYNNQEISLYTALSKPKYEDMNSYLLSCCLSSINIYNAGPFMKHFCKMMKEDQKAMEILNEDINCILICDGTRNSYSHLHVPISGTLFHPFVAQRFCNSLEVYASYIYREYGPDPRNFLLAVLTGTINGITVDFGSGLFNCLAPEAFDPYAKDSSPFDGVAHIATGSEIKCVPTFLPSNFLKNDKYSYTGYMCFCYDSFEALCRITAKQIIVSVSTTYHCVGPTATSLYASGNKKTVCCIPARLSYIQNNRFTSTSNLMGHWSIVTGDNSDYVEIDVIDPLFEKGKNSIDEYIVRTNTGAYLQYSGIRGSTPIWCDPIYFNPNNQYYSDICEIYSCFLKIRSGNYCRLSLKDNVSNAELLITQKSWFIEQSGFLSSSTLYKSNLEAHLRQGLICSNFCQSKLKFLCGGSEDSKISYSNIIQTHRPSIESFRIFEYQTGIGVADTNNDSYCSNQYTELYLWKLNEFGLFKETLNNGLTAFCVGSPYSLQILNKNAPLFKIMSITENYINEYNILATEYKENKFEEIEENVQIDSLQDTFNALYYYQPSSRLTEQVESLKSPIINSITKIIYGNTPVLEIIWTPVSEHIKSVGGSLGTRYRIYVQSPSKQTPNLQAIVGDDAIQADGTFKYNFQGDGTINPLKTEIGTFIVSIEAFYEKDGAYLFSTPVKRSINLLSY